MTLCGLFFNTRNRRADAEVGGVPALDSMTGGGGNGRWDWGAHNQSVTFHHRFSEKSLNQYSKYFAGRRTAHTIPRLNLVFAMSAK